MNKRIAILLVLCMLLGLFAACGEPGTGSAASVPQSTVETVPEEAQTPTESAAETTPKAPASVEENSAEETETLEAQNFEIAMPLTEEPVTLSFFMRFNPQVQDWCQDMSDNLFYLSLIHI